MKGNDGRLCAVLLLYLPLSHAFKLGRWLVLPTDQYGGAWVNNWHEKRVRQLVKRFVDGAGGRIKL